jgi:hypothetical protein
MIPPFIDFLHFNFKTLRANAMRYPAVDQFAIAINSAAITTNRLDWLAHFHLDKIKINNASDANAIAQPNGNNKFGSKTVSSIQNPGVWPNNSDSLTAIGRLIGCFPDSTSEIIALVTPNCSASFVCIPLIN